MSDVIEVTPVAVEPPAVLGDADRWLAEQREKVAARRGDFSAHEIQSAQDYRESKAQRAALRRLIKEVDDGRKAMTSAIDDALRGFRLATKDVLADLTEEEMAYRSEIERWERQIVTDREARIEARYLDEWPDLAEQVPYSRLKAAFGAPWKAGNAGTKEAAIWAGVEEAATRVAEDVETLRAQDMDEGERVEVMADYLRSLDLSAALRAGVERRRQRESVRRAEEERRAWEAEQAARQAAIDYEAAEAVQEAARATEARAEAAPAPDAQTAPSAPQAASESPVVAYVYEVTVPAAKLHEFMEAMRAIEGTHGVCVRKVR